ncbi:MAG: ATP:cob(I)alamin adenosyltransferase, partial [Flavobacteriaceae bacterium]
MKKMKVYTKTGDDGTTGLLSGERVHKHHLRVKAYGTIDELNAWLGLIRDLDKNQDNQQFLILIQKKLMILGAQ